MSIIKRYNKHDGGYMDEEDNGEWCKYSDVKDLSLRIAIAVRYMELQPVKRTQTDVSWDVINILTMPIESLHEFIKNNPQYGDV